MGRLCGFAVLCSFVLGESQTCTLPTQQGVRISGNDIGSQRSATSGAECCSLCSLEPTCKAFLWVDDSRHVCWLKTKASDPIACSNCVAGGIGQPTPPPAPTPPTPACTDDIGCNMAGRCVSGSCTCDAGWTGEHCERIKFGRSYGCGEGGLCLNHTAAAAATGSGTSYADNFTASWGGEVVRGDNDTDWHMYAASFGQDSTLNRSRPHADSCGTQLRLCACTTTADCAYTPCEQFLC
jgi:hypothetical protein